MVSKDNPSIDPSYILQLFEGRFKNTVPLDVHAMNLEKVLPDSLIEQGVLLPRICFSSAKVKGTNRPKHWYFSTNIDDLCSRVSHNDRLLSETIRNDWRIWRHSNASFTLLYVPAVPALKLNCHVSVCMKTCIYMTIYSLHLRSKYRVDGDIKILRSSSKYKGWNFNSGNYLFTTDTK